MELLSRKGALSAYFTRRIMEMRHQLLLNFDRRSSTQWWQLGRPFSRSAGRQEWTRCFLIDREVGPETRRRSGLADGL
ncbi:hypothetical protein [Azospirillum argentinense]